MKRLVLAFLLPACLVAADAPVYEKDIAPIFRTYCAGCHNDTDLEGGFSVETFAKLSKGGDEHDAPITAGDAEQSLLVKLIQGKSKPKMPPKDEPQVPAEDIEMLKKWITAGAPGPQRDESILLHLVVPTLPPSTKPQPLTGASFSSNGKFLALARHTTVEITDVATGARHSLITGFPGPVNAVHFSKDGTRIIAAGGIPGLTGVAQIRDSATGTLIREFSQHLDALYDAEFSPDEKILATAGYDRVIRIWNVAEGKLLASMDVHKGTVYDLAFDPTGKVLASASADETVKLWRMPDGERLDTLNAPQGEQVAVLFTTDGNHILSSGADKRIHLWRLLSRDKPGLNPLVHSRFAHETPIVALALSADGKFALSTAVDRTIKIWSLPALELRHAYPPQPDIISTLAALPGTDQFLTARMDGGISRMAMVTPPIPAPSEMTQAIVPRSDAVATAISKMDETEPNDQPSAAVLAAIPAEIKGHISQPGDADIFRFRVKKGEALVVETNASRSKSNADTRIEILHPDGKPVEQVVLQATRDSWFTFRGKNSDESDDFRVHNWEQMELNEYLYANGEVVKLWLYPRGPDSGFKTYPGDGKRHTAFFTTALTHALGEPAYIVSPLPPGSLPAPNGLPVFRLHYENDDDSQRLAGSDSALYFTPPADGEYLVRVTDVRGFGEKKDFHYTLVIRPQKPDFKITLSGQNPKISPGNGREFIAKAQRMDGYDGPIKVTVENLPPGFSIPAPIQIEAGQVEAAGIIFAAADAPSPDDAADKAVKITATATMGDRELVHEVGTLGNIEIGAPAKVRVEILPGKDRSYVKETPGQPLEFSIRPGQTISAVVRAERVNFPGLIELGKEGAGRNLPHGLFVDNIGLNGLLLVEGQNEREFFITAAPIAKPGTRLFHLKTVGDDGQCSKPALIHVLPVKASGTAAN